MFHHLLRGIIRRLTDAIQPSKKFHQSSLGFIQLFFGFHQSLREANQSLPDAWQRLKDANQPSFMPFLRKTANFHHFPTINPQPSTIN
jgi:hypothetical protein